MTGARGDRLRRYHEATKHSLESVRSSRHDLDWENQPLPFRIYPGLRGERLPLEGAPAGVSVLAAVRSPPAARDDVAPDRAALARLLHFSLGIIRRRDLGDGRTMYFRAAACTGALYHVDAWVVCGDLPDLQAGVYHFGPHDFSLTRLRAGDFRGVLAEASGGEPHVASAPAVVVLASTWWRNAWKYRSRAYRHVFWDSGTILAQLLAQAAADRWPAHLVTAFADPAVERLCGLDPSREGPAALVALGAGSRAGPPPGVSPLDAPTERLSPHEVDHPAIPRAHADSSLADGPAARAWRAAVAAPARDGPSGEIVRLPPPADGGEPLERVIARRGSTRVFGRESITAGELSTILGLAGAPVAADYRSDPAAAWVELFLIVHAVDGLEPGAWRVRPEAGGLERLAAGDFRREAGFLGLGQEIPADAAVNVYALADLDALLGTHGDRGYRAAQLDGAIAGGRVYLGAYAQRLGASGLTFFDDEVARFFGRDPRRWGVMFLAAVGHGRRRR